MLSINMDLVWTIINHMLSNGKIIRSGSPSKLLQELDGKVWNIFLSDNGQRSYVGAFQLRRGYSYTSSTFSNLFG